MEAYRVRKNFGWDGWEYAPAGPNGVCKCNCGEVCTHLVGSSCRCKVTICRCDCGIREEQYAGDIWLVQDGHPNKDHMIARHFATYDAAIPSVDELVTQDEYKRLLTAYVPSPVDGRRKQKVA